MPLPASEFTFSSKILYSEITFSSEGSEKDVTEGMP